IISPTMTTRSAGQLAATSRGGGTVGRAGKGGGRTRGHFGDQGSHVVELSNPHMRSRSRYRLVPHLVSPEGKRIEWYEWVNKKNPEKRGSKGEPSKDSNERDDNKRTRTGNAFAITTNPVRREYTGTTPKCTTCNYHHSPETTCRACFNYQSPGHFAKDCRDVHRNVNPINARNLTARTCYECGSKGGNRPNQALANNGGQGHRNQGNQARVRAFTLGAEEARQDPNIMTVTFTLNDHYATTLPDSGADYSFVSTTFIPLLDLEPKKLGFSYEIEIASGQLVEIDKVIRGCKLEIKGHVFDINLIPFGSGSFDVIIGMDWLSDHKAEIICHEKVVRIQLLDGKVLRVLREKLEEKIRQLMSAMAKEKKQEEIVVMRDFPEVFLDDLSRLPPIQEIEFQIELIPKATPVAKSPYRLAPSELEELLGQLKELLNKDPSKIEAVKNWKAPRTSSEVRSFLGLARHEDFVVYCDASGLGLGYALMQRSKSSIKDRILETQKGASDESAGLQKGLDEMVELRNDGTLYYLD
ncbi:putative reverse transcriptase domain-containing protein, partial [Tanacetum coccineum]